MGDEGLRQTLASCLGTMRCSRSSWSGYFFPTLSDTPDQVLSTGPPGRSQTCNPGIKSPLRYQLRHGRMIPHLAVKSRLRYHYAKEVRYPSSDSNRHWYGFEPHASANWATGAWSVGCTPHVVLRLPEVIARGRHGAALSPTSQASRVRIRPGVCWAGLVQAMVQVARIELAAPA
jgi:hypothetical protein